MALYNLTQRGNCIYLEVEGDANNYTGYKKDVKMRLMLSPDPIRLKTSGMLLSPADFESGAGVSIEDISIDGVDATEETLKAFIEENTGNFNGGGTAPTFQVFRGIVFKEDNSTDPPVLIESENTIGTLNVSRQSAGVYVISGFSLPTENNLQAYISSLVTDEKTVSVAVNDVDGEVIIQNRESGVLADENFRISLRIELTPP